MFNLINKEKIVKVVRAPEDPLWIFCPLGPAPVFDLARRLYPFPVPAPIPVPD